MVQYKLHYFNIRGRAELARLVFAAAGQAYEDIRLDKENWPALKPTTQTGQVPFLEVHDGSSIFKMSQSIAIARFLAKRFNLAGGSEFEQAEVDMYGDQISDLLNEIIKALFETDAKRKEASNVKMRTETLPNSLKIFENKLNQTNTGYLVGNSLTWADLYLFNVVETALEKHPSSLDNVSAVKKHYNAVRSLPNIAKWIASRPVTPM